MATGTTRDQPVNERRNRSQEMIQAAVDVFHEKGYAGTTVQDLAERIGVLKGSLYHYIDSKEDLLARIFEEAAERSAELVRSSDQLEGTAAERLREFARSWCLWYMRDVERAGIYTKEWTELTGERLAVVRRDRQGYERHLAGLIDAVKDEGAAAPGLETRYASQFVFSAVNGIPLWFRRDGRDPSEPVAAAYAEMIVGALCGSRPG